MKQRNETITIAKAFAIMMMVVAHAGIFSSARHFIYMFHMPLFFFCSGYCFKSKYLSDARGFVVRRLRGLYIPHLKWCLVFLALHNVFFHLHIYDDQYGFNGWTQHLYGWQDFARIACKIVFVMGGSEQLLGGYWFLRSLLIASIIGFITIKFIPKKAIGGGIWLTISILTKALNIDKVSFDAMATAFFVFGNVFASHTIITLRQAIIVFFIVCIGAYFLPMEMIDQTVASTLPYATVATIGSLMALKVANVCDLRLKKGFFRQLLLFIGDHTLEILTWHFLCFKLVSLFIIMIEQRPIKQLAYFPVIPADADSGSLYSHYWLLYFLVGIGIPILFTALRSRIKNRKTLSSTQ